MILENNVIGKRVALRTARPDDAEFILKLRLNPKLNRFLHETDPSVEKQRAYIAAKQRQENDYHMIIETIEGKRLGVVAVYDINPVEKTFVWGRWLIDPDFPGYAVETAILIYHFAFNVLNLQTAIMDVVKDNAKVVAIHNRLGAEVTGSDNENIYFRFPKTKFKNLLERYRDRHNFKLGFAPGAAIQCPAQGNGNEKT